MKIGFDDVLYHEIDDAPERVQQESPVAVLKKSEKINDRYGITAAMSAMISGENTILARYWKRVIDNAILLDQDNLYCGLFECSEFIEMYINNVVDYINVTFYNVITHNIKYISNHKNIVATIKLFTYICGASIATAICVNKKIKYLPITHLRNYDDAYVVMDGNEKITTPQLPKFMFADFDSFSFGRIAKIRARHDTKYIVKGFICSKSSGSDYDLYEYINFYEYENAKIVCVILVSFDLFDYW